MNRLVLSAVLVAATVSAGAGDYAIINARVHTLGAQGTLDNATVLIQEGRITAVGPNIDVPDATTVINAAGRPVTPGIFDVLSALGAVEVSLAEDTNDTAHSGRYGAGFDIADAINPRSSLIDVNRIEGVTRALVVPQAPYGEPGNVLVGQAAAIALDPRNENVVVTRGAALIAYLGESGSGLAGGSRAAAVQILREALEDADDYNRHRDDYDEGDRRDYSISRLDLQALLPVVSGRTPLIIYADRMSDLKVIIELKKELSLNVIIAGGAEAWMIADELADNDISVILDPLDNLPGSFDSLNVTLENATRLHKAGVLIAFSQGDSHNPRNLTQAAGNAVANGLDWDTAFKAITINPARMLDLDDTCCTLEPGVAADVVLWDGDPLEVTSFADEVFVRGQRVDMRSRQTLLRDRYRDLGGPLPPAYSKP